MGVILSPQLFVKLNYPVKYTTGQYLQTNFYILHQFFVTELKLLHVEQVGSSFRNIYTVLFVILNLFTLRQLCLSTLGHRVTLIFI